MIKLNEDIGEKEIKKFRNIMDKRLNVGTKTKLRKIVKPKNKIRVIEVTKLMVGQQDQIFIKNKDDFMFIAKELKAIVVFKLSGMLHIIGNTYIYVCEDK